MTSKKIYYSIVLFFVLLCSGCTHKSPGHSSGHVKDTAVVANEVENKTFQPSITMDSTSSVRGYQTQKYNLPVETEGVYSINVSSANTGLIFVIQDAEGNNVINETSPAWTGNLKKGDYTIIVGLMRNAARKNLKKDVTFTIKVEQTK